ncbi:MAG: hypothetical protein M1118_03555 [Chloroflexi bacterium]|nr:hypothetical protein [Chloroflexota bacterium]
MTSTCEDLAVQPHRQPGLVVVESLASLAQRLAAGLTSRTSEPGRR